MHIQSMFYTQILDSFSLHRIFHPLTQTVVLNLRTLATPEDKFDCHIPYWERAASGI